MHSVCKVSLPGTPLSCMLKVNGFSLNPQTPQTLFHLIRKVETCCSNVKVLKFPAFAITANCSSRGQITFTLPIGIQFQSFPKLSKAYVQRTFGHKTNIKTNSARKDRKEGSWVLFTRSLFRVPEPHDAVHLNRAKSRICTLYKYSYNYK